MVILAIVMRLLGELGRRCMRGSFMLGILDSRSVQPISWGELKGFMVRFRFWQWYLVAKRMVARIRE